MSQGQQALVGPVVSSSAPGRAGNSRADGLRVWPSIVKFYDVEQSWIRPVAVATFLFRNFLVLSIAYRTDPRTGRGAVPFQAGNTPTLQLPGVSQAYNTCCQAIGLHWFLYNYTLAVLARAGLT
jgi:hypothetical protein